MALLPLVLVVPLTFWQVIFLRPQRWMQRNRLEWLYRLYLEPQRIGRMLAIPKFMWTVIRNK